LFLTSGKGPNQFQDAVQFKVCEENYAKLPSNGVIKLEFEISSKELVLNLILKITFISVLRYN